MLRRLTPAIHRLDEAIGRLKPIRDVLIELRTPVYQAVLGPIADGLSARGGTSVWYTSEYPDRIAPLVPQGTFLTHRQVEWRRFDLYVNGDPWAAARLRRCAHRINFFHGVAGKYDLDRPSGLPMGFEYYDRVAFINRDRMERYLDARIVTAAQAVLIGYPKLDRLANGGWDGARIRTESGLDAHHPTVLYAPTYSMASSLHLAGEAIVSGLADAGFNVLVKLHDRSLDADPKYSGGIDWRTRMRGIERPGRVRFVEGADASPWLAAADLMVTDHSSVGFEYFVLDRPLIVFDAPDLAHEARINPEKIALLRSAATVVRNVDELVHAAAAEVAAPARLSAIRRRVAADLFYQPGTATDRAVALARELLGMPSVTTSLTSRDAAIARPAG
ncbi:MAG TPA: CDP-glycerol glycerophosphotransferase family protein [Vicinamibacterales bacterium]|nr:CDP-glycerol glycerophosphotransferase family protein [Vicinamibacterales bacterium]